MLLNRNSDVNIYKMANGDEVVALQVHPEVTETAGFISITKPVAIVLRTDQSGTQRLAMAPVLFSANDSKTILLNMAQVLMVATPSKETVDAYMQATSEIQLVT